ncbi:MAG: hypothetical protein IJT95_07390 [Abditibacteriota bacterium]|nr:hypothetical protein [Abditibacteriota bacterium]
MRKVFLFCVSLLFVIMASPAFCGELNVIRYSESALNRALSDNLPVALWFTDDEDYESQQLERDILNNGQFVAAVEVLIWLKVDLTGPANRTRYRTLCEEYNVTKIPSIIYLNTDGREYKNARTSGYTKSDDILATLIAGAVIGWLINEAWDDDYYYNNNIVYRNNNWWRYDNDWIFYDNRYLLYDRYRNYRHPDYIFPSRRPGRRPYDEFGPHGPGHHPFPPSTGPDERPPLPPSVGPGGKPSFPPSVKRPKDKIGDEFRRPYPPTTRPQPNIAKPGPGMNRPNSGGSFPSVRQGTGSKPSVSKPVKPESKPFPDKKPAQPRPAPTQKKESAKR